ncbi:hypothetical protein COLO4_24732 [Corchorus olitorius]|uniref:Uncharacterized protein n=1 Tax=Corchorus olitorius TaxID=93759 RepID=A0A1R3I7D8_9ROSI|nr:hypothetical protein COLO4_24732 [Corchorus olitorius]
MQWFGQAVKSAPKRPKLVESTHGGESDKAIYLANAKWKLGWVLLSGYLEGGSGW